MATFNLSTEYSDYDWSSLFPFRPDPDKGYFKTVQFNFQTPGVNQDTSYNSIAKGDLVYIDSNGAQLIEVETTNATLKGASVINGICTGVWSDDGRTLYGDLKNFTADGGLIQVFVGKNIEIYTNKVYIHSRNGASADTRIPLVPATHAAGSAVLEGIIKIGSTDPVRPTFTFIQ